MKQQKVQAILMATDKHNVGNITKFITGDNRLVIVEKGSYLEEFPREINNWQPQHLHIISDEEIKEADWFLADNRLNTSQNNGKPNWILCKCTKVVNTWVYCNEIPDEGHNGDWAKKIIASKDKSLGLPAPDNNSIQYILDEFNSGKTEVYGVIDLQTLDYHKNPETDITKITYEEIRTNPDNTISIKAIEESWDDIIHDFIDDYKGPILLPEELVEWLEKYYSVPTKLK